MDMRESDGGASLSPRYDLMNRLMTGGMDRRWRILAADAARPNGRRVLDIATGTGDLAIDLARAGARQVVGADFAAAMLVSARPKVGGSIPLVLADAQRLPFGDATFDAASHAETELRTRERDLNRPAATPSAPATTRCACCSTSSRGG